MKTVHGALHKVWPYTAHGSKRGIHCEGSREFLVFLSKCQGLPSVVEEFSQAASFHQTTSLLVCFFRVSHRQPVPVSFRTEPQVSNLTLIWPAHLHSLSAFTPPAHLDVLIPFLSPSLRGLSTAWNSFIERKIGGQKCWPASVCWVIFRMRIGCWNYKVWKLLH